MESTRCKMNFNVFFLKKSIKDIKNNVDFSFLK
jgi:hypothetical protein